MEYAIAEVCQEQVDRIMADAIKLSELTERPVTLELSVLTTISEALNYCNRKDIPDRGLEIILARIVAEQLRLEMRNRQAESGELVSSVSQGDSSISYNTATKDVDTNMASWAFAGYTTQLNRYRRLPRTRVEE